MTQKYTDEPSTLIELLEELKSCVAKNLYFEICPQDAKALLDAFVFSTVHNGNLAAALAHRACGNQENDLDNGKLAGYCIVCQIPWPCETAQAFLRKPQP